MNMGEMIYGSVRAAHPIDGIYFTIQVTESSGYCRTMGSFPPKKRQ